jgi:hypothetical protein
MGHFFMGYALYAHNKKTLGETINLLKLQAGVDSSKLT